MSSATLGKSLPHSVPQSPHPQSTTCLSGYRQEDGVINVRGEAGPKQGWTVTAQGTEPWNGRVPEEGQSQTPAAGET